MPIRARLPKVVSKANPSVAGLRNTAISPGQGTACAATIGRCAGWSSDSCGRSSSTHIRRAEHHGPGQRGRARIAGRQIIGGAVLADGLDAAAIGIGDGHQPQLDLAAVMDEPDHVGGVQRQPRGRQAEGGAFAADPGFHQRAAAAAFGLLGRDCHREALGGDAGGVDGDAAGFDKGRVVILVGARDLPLQRLRQFGFLRADQFQCLALAGDATRSSGAMVSNGRPPAHDEADHAFASRWHRTRNAAPAC